MFPLRIRRTDCRLPRFAESVVAVVRVKAPLGLEEFELTRGDVVQMGVSYRTEGIARPYRGAPGPTMAFSAGISRAISLPFREFPSPG